jgi:hypothetical protein
MTASTTARIRPTARARFNFTALAVLFSVILIRVPYALGLGDVPLVRIAFLFPLLLAAAWQILQVTARMSISLDRRLGTLGGLVLTVLFVAVLRSLVATPDTSGGALAQLVILLVGTAIGGATCWRKGQEDAATSLMRAAVFALPLYVGLNVVAHHAGLRSPLDLYTETPDASMLRALGLPVSRVLFPMAAGWNAFGLVAGGSLAVSLALALGRGSRLERLGGLLGAALSIWALLLCDSRAALVFSLAAGIGVSLIRDAALARALAWTPVVSLALPVMVVATLLLLPPSVTSLLSRSGSNGDIATLSNRTLVWEAAARRLSSFEPLHLVGYGHQGQVTSGVSRDYGYVFGTYVQSEIRGLHNMYLQLVFDIGYVGLALVLMLWTLLIRRLLTMSRRSTNSVAAAACALFVYSALAGSTDRVPVFYITEIWFVVLLIGIACSTLSRSDRARPHGASTPS